ncbi:hypothetical protein GCM10027176_45720 [Actinoallomurus bryophytorum]|uniref:Uncharacterized protein n=1 Tax=Actinoallomurus bryophytorum TaxID=1490222 RepID=A0A543CCN5_9ACTN|nr:hypothetical protein [Actinoallomurus bryophytorum]TQL94777.1 hypothetical protein FB559_0259 [Actinoallomurus bryophytorum]
MSGRTHAERVEDYRRELRAIPSLTDEQVARYARCFVYLEGLAVSDPEKFDGYMAELTAIEDGTWSSE